MNGFVWWPLMLGHLMGIDSAPERIVCAPLGVVFWNTSIRTMSPRSAVPPRTSTATLSVGRNPHLADDVALGRAGVGSSGFRLASSLSMPATPQQSRHAAWLDRRLCRRVPEQECGQGQPRSASRWPCVRRRPDAPSMSRTCLMVASCALPRARCTSARETKISL